MDTFFIDSDPEFCSRACAWSLLNSLQLCLRALRYIRNLAMLVIGYGMSINIVEVRKLTRAVLLE